MLVSDDQNLGSRPTGETRRKKEMSPTLEARVLMRGTWPLERYGKLDNIFYEAVRFVAPRVTKQFTQRRARSIWEGTARRIDSEEMDALREAEIEFARREQEALRARLAALDEKIAAFDAVTASQAVAKNRGDQNRMG